MNEVYITHKECNEKHERCTNKIITIDDCARCRNSLKTEFQLVTDPLKMRLDVIVLYMKVFIYVMPCFVVVSQIFGADILKRIISLIK